MSITRSLRRASMALALVTTAAVPVLAADSAPTIRWVPASVSTDGKSPGYVLFQNDCAVCHGDGPAKPGTRALKVKYGGKLPALLEERTDLSPELIRSVIRQGLTVMPPFRKTEMSDADLELIVGYLTRRR